MLVLSLLWLYNLPGLAMFSFSTASCWCQLHDWSGGGKNLPLWEGRVCVIYDSRDWCKDSSSSLDGSYWVRIYLDCIYCQQISDYVFNFDSDSLSHWQSCLCPSWLKWLPVRSSQHGTYAWGLMKLVMVLTLLPRSSAAPVDQHYNCTRNWCKENWVNAEKCIICLSF